MNLIVSILFLLFSVIATEKIYPDAQIDWKYNLRGNATDGLPCLTNCINRTCIVDWKENTKDCWSTNLPAPKFRTTQLIDKNNLYCLSNCGYFGFPYQWCVTSAQKGWDYCNAELRALTIYNKPCTSTCRKGTSVYYWCFVENGSDWQYCAPPREDNSD